MNSQQYEELCRFFLADKLGVNVDEVRSAEIPNPRRPGLPEYKHQIDLYWETGNELTLYLNIANAKWRSTRKVNQGEVLLLHQVKQKVGAQKAVMITNSGFTSGAKAVAQDEGIALHIVKPHFDYSILHSSDRQVILTQIQEIRASESKPVYFHEVLYRAFDLAAIQTPLPEVRIPHKNKMVSGKGLQRRVIVPPSTKNVGSSQGSGVQRVIRRQSKTTKRIQTDGNPFKGGKGGGAK